MPNLDEDDENTMGVKGFLQMRNKLDCRRGPRIATSEISDNTSDHIPFSDEDISMTTFLVEQSQTKITLKVEEKLMVDQIDALLGHTEADANNAAATLEIVGVFMNKAKTLIGADRCSLFLVDEIRGELCTAYASGSGQVDAEEGNSSHAPGKLVIRLPMGKGLVGDCAETGVEILINDCQSDPRFDKASDKRNKYHTRTCICVPIKNSVGQVLGVVQMLNKELNGETVLFSEEDIRKLRSIAAKATVAIERAQMFAKLQLIMDASNKINASSADIDVLVARTMSSARRLLNADRCTLFMYDAATDRLYSRITDEALTTDLSGSNSSGQTNSRYAVMDKGNAKIVFDAHKGIAGKAVTTKQSINCADVYDDPTFNQHIDQETGYRTKSVLCVPVMSSTGEVLGVSQMVNKLNSKGEAISFNDQDEKLMRAFVSQVAVAVSNSHLFSHTFKTLSQSLSILAALPDVVLAIGADGQFVECNRPLKEALGIEEANNVENLANGEKKLHLHFSEWLAGAPTDLVRLITQAFDSRASGKEVQWSFEPPLVFGQYTYISGCASPLTDTGGMVVVLRCSHQPEERRRQCHSTMLDNAEGDVRNAKVFTGSISHA